MPTQNIVLIGFMGTGKTSVGQVLSARLGMPLVDMDEMIVARQGKPISRIFAEDGEAHFRQLERALVGELAQRSGLIISTGGGIVLNPTNVTDFEATSLVVCLTAQPETILQRVAQETHRPLLAVDDKLGRIREILSTRQPLYNRVRVQLPTDALTVGEIADRIAAIFSEAT